MGGKNHSTTTATPGNHTMAKTVDQGDGSQIIEDPSPTAPIVARSRGKIDHTKTNSRLGINGRTNSNNNFTLVVQKLTHKNGMSKTTSIANRRLIYAHGSQSH